MIDNANSIQSWLRNDPFGPEIFGLSLELLIFLVLIPIVAALWARMRARKNIAERAAQLFAKYHSVRNATKRFTALIISIRRGEFLQRKYGITNEELQRLYLDSDHQNDDLPEKLTDEERQEIAERQSEIFESANKFDEYAREIAIYIADRSVKHNIEETRKQVELARNAVQEVKRYRVRASLIALFDESISREFSKLNEHELKIGKHKSRNNDHKMKS